MASINVDDLTVGEKFFIARRRSGESQEQISSRLGMTRNTYGEIERDTENVNSYIRQHIPELDKLSEEEICIILRRRSGLTQEECASHIGVTRFWVNQMEAGAVPSSQLIKFWENRNEG